MVETIKSLKDSLLRHMETVVAERGAEHLDMNMVDMVKDLAEAEKECWEAEYYRNAAESMESRMGYGDMRYIPEDTIYGYNTMGGRGNSSGYSQGGNQGNSRSNWGNQYGSGMSARRGYGSMGHQDAEEGVRSILETAKPDEKERIKQMLKRELGM